jgi:hypothetical protein
MRSSGNSFQSIRQNQGECQANGTPMSERWHQDDALTVRENATGEPADGPAEKVLAQRELHDVIAWARVRQQSMPGFTFHLCSCHPLDGLTQVASYSPPFE